MGGGGCFACFSSKDKQKLETPTHDPNRPSIGTPTGFVHPEEQTTSVPETSALEKGLLLQLVTSSKAQEST